MAIREQQVKLYMSQRESGTSQLQASAKAGFSESTGRRIEKRGGRVTKKPRHWRTHKDAFSEVWESQLVPLLEKAPDLQAVTLLEWLQERYPEHYPDTLLRTLQRRVQKWRLLHGPGKEIMFSQTHEPGQQGLSDFTKLKRAVITIGGKPLAHLLYHFRLAFSGWSYLKVILGGESFTALAEGLTQALERLGGAPGEHRTDSLSAAFKNLSKDEKRDITGRYEALCEQYNMVATRNNRGKGHENGSIESPHGHLKRRIEQALKLRGSCDFDSITAYQAFIDQVVAKSNRRNAKKLHEEHPYLQPLPAHKAVDYTEIPAVRVTRHSTLNVRLVVYSVPSRLIGERFNVHLYDDRLVLYHGLTEVLTLPRIYPVKGRRRGRSIDYRHLIDWLARKPMAFQGLCYRDELLPNETYHQLWRHLTRQSNPRQACKLMVGALKLAADRDCEQALGAFWLSAIEQGKAPSLAQLQGRFGNPPSPPPAQRFKQHELADYDALLSHRSTVQPTLEVPHA